MKRRVPLLLGLLALVIAPAYAAIPASERAALIALYDSTNGDGWTNKTGWEGEAGTECMWFGVTCDSTLANVSELRLYGNQLTGTIPPELGNLANLQTLSLSFNQLTGSIPAELGSLAKLRILTLVDNQLTGTIPKSLGNLTELSSLDLDSNRLTGTIPAELGRLSNLTSRLWLNNNQLTGSIPAELGKLVNTRELALNNNQLTGTIPPELGNLANLQDLFLGSNELTGSIPAELGSLANLRRLDLHGNQLSGSIPAKLGSLANLRRLDLHDNQLTGTIPPELGDLANLQDFLLYSNQLSGSIPARLGKLANLTYLWLHENELTGSIPPELGDLPNLVWLWLYSNKLIGGIPPALGNSANLQSLNLSQNQLTGVIPKELARLVNLQSLELFSNQLMGIIPIELHDLTNLRRLMLDSNQLTGSIPPELGNLANVTNLGLSYNGLIATEPRAKAWADTKQPGWELTQTVAPANISVAPSGSSSLQVAWAPIPFQSFGGRYELFVDSGSGFGLAGATPDKATSSFIVTGLDPNRTYRLRLRTVTDPHAENQGTVTSEPSAVVEGTTSSECSPVSIVSQPANASIDDGQVATLNVVARGTAPSYQWYIGVSGDRSRPVAGATGPSFTTPPLRQTTAYWVEVRNQCPSAVSSGTATVSVAVRCNPVSIALNPSNQTIAANQSGTLNVAVTGTEPKFQWYSVENQSASVIAGATGPSYTTPALARSSSYRVMVSNRCPSDTTSSTATVTVGFKTTCERLRMTLPPSDTFTSKGSSVTINTVVTGSSPSYQWYRGAVHDASSPIPGANGPSYTTPPLGESAKYWVAVWSNSCPGTIFSPTATVTVPSEGRRRAVDRGP